MAEVFVLLAGFKVSEFQGFKDFTLTSLPSVPPRLWACALSLLPSAFARSNRFQGFRVSRFQGLAASVAPLHYQFRSFGGLVLRSILANTLLKRTLGLQGFRGSKVAKTRGLEVVVARSYRELLVWQKAKALAVHTYQATADFPRTETYGLTSQIRRSSVSVVSNIAEGQGRLTAGEFRHFLGQARGSLLEADTQLAIAVDLGYLGQEPYEALERASYQVLGLLDRLLNSLSKKTA